MKISDKITTHPVFYPLMFLAVAALLYGRAVFFDITYFDDHLWVKTFDDYLTRGIHWWEFFGKPDLVTEIYYRPLLNLSFLWDARLGHGAVWPYHLTNLLLHALCGCFLFRLLEEWGFARGRALAGTLIFLVHPALVQAVAWIPGRTDSLLGLFCFSGFFFFLRWQRLERSRDLAAYALCLAGALLSKETGIVLGFMVILWNVLQSREKGLSVRKAWPIPALTSGIVFVWALVRLQIVSGGPEMGWDRKIHSFVSNLPSVWLYLGKVFLPFNLSVFPMMKDSSLVYGYLSAGLVLIWVMAVKTKSLRDILFGSVWFTFFLLPSLVLSTLAYEYRLYVPMLGALIVVLELIPKNLNRRAAVAMVVVAAALFSAVSWKYSDSFHDQWVFWTRAAAEAPHSALAQKNLGSMYYFRENYDKAEEYYLKALQINPLEQMVNNNLGLVSQKRGDFPKAVEYYRREILYYPDYELPYLNWGLLMIEEGKPDQAAGFMEKALQCNPLLKEPYDYLMQIYLRQGDFEKAKATARRLKAAGSDIPLWVIQQALRLNVNLFD